MRFQISINEFVRCAISTLRAYAISDLIRSKGLLFSFMGIAMWLILFILPLIFFAGEGYDKSTVATFIFSGLIVFNLYMVGTWDLGWEVRLLINQGIMEYLILTGRNPLIIYFGLIPLTIIWIGIVLAIGYWAVTLFVAPPRIVIVGFSELILASILLMLVILSYALVLASITMTAGTPSFIMELVSWILPIATGGFTPLSSLPSFLKVVALMTPFSYPAEALRYSIGASDPVMSPHLIFMIGYLYAILFLISALIIFKISLNKALKEGFKTVASW